MNQEQLTAIFRQIILVSCGGLVTKGYVDDATLQIIVGAIIALGTAAWGIYLKRRTALIASAAAQTGVEKIVTDPKTADAIPSPKVTSR